MFEKGLLQGKRILVTGGGSGLGAAMGRRFVELGAELIICGRRLELLEATAAHMRGDLGGRISALACDIRDGAAVDAMLDAIWRDAPLDVLVNNAAATFIAQTERLSFRAADAILAPTLHGAMYCTLGAGKRWIEGKHKASVISILTTWIWNGGPFTVPSAMSKAGLNIMTKSLATEWGPNGIRLNAIAPGPFPTKGAWERLSPQSANRGESRNPIPMGRNGEMPELANLAVFLMSDGCDYLTGQTIAIDGAMHLASGGNFAALAALGDSDWERIRGEVKSANDKDKAQRAV